MSSNPKSGKDLRPPKKAQGVKRKNKEGPRLKKGKKEKGRETL